MKEHAAVATSREERIFRITFDRPAKKNALNSAMYAALNAALDESEAADEVRAILLHGAGGDFTSGNDLEDFARFDPAATDGPVVQFLRRLPALTKPLVAAVEGVAGRFQLGRFDGMTDSYEYSHGAFADLFGGVRYVSTNRVYSDHAVQMAIAALVTQYGGPSPSAEDFRSGRLCHESPIGNTHGSYEHSWQTLIHRKLAES